MISAGATVVRPMQTAIDARRSTFALITCEILISVHEIPAGNEDRGQRETFRDSPAVSGLIVAPLLSLPPLFQPTTPLAITTMYTQQPTLHGLPSSFYPDQQPQRITSHASQPDLYPNSRCRSSGQEAEVPSTLKSHHGTSLRMI